jgi:hypothetical protein
MVLVKAYGGGHDSKNKCSVTSAIFFKHNVLSLIAFT